VAFRNNVKVHKYHLRRANDGLSTVAKRPQSPIDVIDKFLLSDRAPDNSMGLSDLDGFLTGIVIGPELIMPSEWLGVIWGDDSPKFRDAKEAQSILTAVMSLYNEIVRGFQNDPPILEPIFWETDDGKVIAADWAEGFHDAIKLRPAAWQALFIDDDDKGSELLRPILILCSDGSGGSLLKIDPSDEHELMVKATDEIVSSVIAIYEFWKSR
jgi:uncharacterized protein